jgi:hypothetical protein
LLPNSLKNAANLTFRSKVLAIAGQVDAISNITSWVLKNVVMIQLNEALLVALDLPG